MGVLHQDASSELLRLVRWLVFGIWFLKVATDALAPVAWLPLSIFEPAGLLALLSVRLKAVLLMPAFLLGLKLATLGLLGWTLVKWHSVAALLACLCLTVEMGILRGFAAHIDHKDLALLYAAYWLAVLPLADRWAAARGETAAKPYTLSGIPIVAILASLCVTYMMVGVFRVTHGQLDVFTSGSMPYWAIRNTFQVSQPDWGWGRYLLEQPWLRAALNAGFPVVTLFEILAPLCLVSARFRLVFALVMVPFHLFSWIFMEVFFWKSLALYVLLLPGGSLQAIIGRTSRLFLARRFP